MTNWIDFCFSVFGVKHHYLRENPKTETEIKKALKEAIKQKEKEER